MTAKSDSRDPGRDAALRELTARNQLQFLRTEIAIARTSLRIAVRHITHRGQAVAESQITCAEHAYTTAASFLAAAVVDESARVQLRRDLDELRRAIQDVRSSVR